MSRLIGLRCIDENALSNTRARLSYLGYEPFDHDLQIDELYLRFSLTFEDVSEMTGYIARSAWLCMAVPDLQGIDWLSMDVKILPTLIEAYPLQLNISNQHSAIERCRIGEIVADTARLRGLPCLSANSGVIIVEHFKNNIATESSDSKYELELQSKLPVPVMFLLGRSSFPARDINQINIGDVLLIEKVKGQVKSKNAILFDFKLEKDSIMILEHTEEIPVDGLEVVSNQPDQRTGSSDINNLPIEISVILFEKTLLLGELKSMLPGEVLQFPHNAQMNVEIRANHRRIANGELVQLPNGQLGVEVCRLFS